MSDVEILCMRALRFAEAPEIVTWAMASGWDEVQEHIMIKLWGPGWGWVKPYYRTFDTWFAEIVEEGSLDKIPIVVGLDEDIVKQLSNRGGSMLAIEDSYNTSSDAKVLTDGGDLEYGVERDY